jgi:8-amino-7-oxononanoate synthase
VLGEHGAGLTVNYPEIDVIIGTASKAFGLQGGTVACNHMIMDYLYNSAKGFIYSTGVSPFLFGALNKVLDIMPTLDNTRKELLDKAHYLRQELNKIGINTLKSNTHIVPAVFSDNETVIRIEKILQNKGFMVKAIRSPTVPSATPRLRLTLNPAINNDNINQLISILNESLI